MKCQKSNSSGRDQQSSRKIKKKHPKPPKNQNTKNNKKNPTKTRVCSGMVPGSGLQKNYLKNSE